MAERKKKIRANLRKNRTQRPRDTDMTRHFDGENSTTDDLPSGERVSGKGELTRKRTVMGAETGDEDTGFRVVLDVDATCLPGRVLSVHGLSSTVEAADGQLHRCATRRLLKTLSTDQRHVVAAGDRVLFRPA